MSLWDQLTKFAKSDTGKTALVGGGSLLLNSGFFDGFTEGEVPEVGYQGTVPCRGACSFKCV